MSIYDELGIEPEQIDKEAKIGHPTETIVNGERVLDFPVSYFYKGKVKNFELRVVPDKQISTVTDKKPGDDDLMETEILALGMTHNEILDFFPPYNAKSPYPFTLKAIIRSIIFEAFVNRDVNHLAGGMVRAFWYTHLIHVIENILGLGETDVVKSTINQAWEDLITSGLVTYDGMNIRSDSEGSTHYRVKDSPFSNLIIAVEKDDKFEYMKWMPRLFNCTLMTAGGQPSRANARRFIMDIRDKARINLNQTFYMCVISDLDPAGYYIQRSFKNQLEKAIQYYGGTGKIEIKRLFVGKNQVTQSLLEHDAIPCYDKGKSDKAKKAENTKWDYFCEQTNGGIYKNVPRSVALSLGAIGPNEHVDSETVRVRAKLELNAFPDHIINDRVIKELLKIIEETSDESLIMIPEIMRIFEEERENAMQEIYEREHKVKIAPFIRNFLRDIDIEQMRKRNLTRDESQKVEDEFEELKEEVEEPFKERIEELEEEADERVPDELAEKKRLEDLIIGLADKLDDVKEDIREKTQDLLDDIEEQEREMEAEMMPHEAERDEKLEDIQNKGEYRQEELEKFKREKETLFNPIEKALMKTIKDLVKQDNLEFFFDDLEADRKTRGHISKLIHDPTALLDEEMPCLEHVYPVFKEKDLLRKASDEQMENVEAHRRGFTTDFLEDMRQLVHQGVEDRGFEFEVREIGELEDFSDELIELVEQIEKDIENGLYKDDDDGDEGAGEW